MAALVADSVCTFDEHVIATIAIYLIATYAIYAIAIIAICLMNAHIVTIAQAGICHFLAVSTCFPLLYIRSISTNYLIDNFIKNNVERAFF